MSTSSFVKMTTTTGAAATSVAVSGDGSTLVYAATDRKIYTKRLFSLADSVETEAIELKAENGNAYSLALDYTGQFMCAGLPLSATGAGPKSGKACIFTKLGKSSPSWSRFGEIPPFEFHELPEGNDPSTYANGALFGSKVELDDASKFAVVSSGVKVFPTGTKFEVVTPAVAMRKPSDPLSFGSASASRARGLTEGELPPGATIPVIAYATVSGNGGVVAFTGGKGDAIYVKSVARFRQMATSDLKTDQYGLKIPIPRDISKFGAFSEISLDYSGMVIAAAIVSPSDEIAAKDPPRVVVFSIPNVLTTISGKVDASGVVAIHNFAPPVPESVTVLPEKFITSLALSRNGKRVAGIFPTLGKFFVCSVKTGTKPWMSEGILAKVSVVARGGTANMWRALAPHEVGARVVFADADGTSVAVASIDGSARGVTLWSDGSPARRDPISAKSDAETDRFVSMLAKTSKEQIVAPSGDGTLAKKPSSNEAVADFHGVSHGDFALPPHPGEPDVVPDKGNALDGILSTHVKLIG